MFIFLFSIIVATAAGVTAFLLIVSGSVEQFRENLEPTLKHLPIITNEGDLLNTKEDVDAQLDILKDKLEEKKAELMTNKTRVSTAAESISKLDTTSAEVRKYYLKLKSNIVQSEKDCQDLQAEIEKYRIKRIALKSELRKDEELFISLLDDMSQYKSYDFQQKNSINSYPTESVCHEPSRDYTPESRYPEEETVIKKHSMQCSCQECSISEQENSEEATDNVSKSCRSYQAKEVPEKMGKAPPMMLYPPPRSGVSASCPESFNAFIGKIQEPMQQAVQRNLKKPGKKIY